MPQIRIESILGGHSQFTNFAREDQYRVSLGIDPGQPLDDNGNVFSSIASGLLRPAPSEKFSGTVVGSAPLWITSQPKNDTIYIYDANGSAYTTTSVFGNVTALSDGGTLSNSNGEGMAYYDNYIYFAKNTDIARYGPLSGVPVFTGTYWTGTLGLTTLGDQDLPSSYQNSLRYPNHQLKRHSDGRLYFADNTDGRGQINYIATTKTAVEGDTNNGSTYNALRFGFNLFITTIESYGNDLAIALYEGSASSLRQQPARIAFWDTTSASFNKITWVEFPDGYISAMKNINGVLYVVSGQPNLRGFRISRFIGGYSYQEVWYSEIGEPSLPGAIDGNLNRILFGNFTNVPESDGCVWSLGLQNSFTAQGFFNIMRSTGGNNSTSVTSIFIPATAITGNFMFNTPIIGWTQAGDGSTGANHGLDKQITTYSNAPSVWWSQTYRIGQRFKITRIRIPLSKAITANMTLIPTIYLDDGIANTALTTINNTNYTSSERAIVIRPENLTGWHNFWLQLRWTGSALLTVSLPITIQYELIED